jgi:hypothetical protein
MRRTISETALERKQKMHLPANDLQTLTHTFSKNILVQADLPEGHG